MSNQTNSRTQYFVNSPQCEPVVVEGRVVKQADVRFTGTGIAVTDLKVALSRSYPLQQSGEWGEETSFPEVTFWREAANRAAALQPGTIVKIRFNPTSLKARVWTDKDGQPMRNEAGDILSSITVQGLGLRVIGYPVNKAPNGNGNGASVPVPSPEGVDFGDMGDDI